MEIKKLNAAQWAGLIDTFEAVFDSDLPNYEHGVIYGAFDNGKLLGFVLVEDVKVVGQIFVKEPKNNATVVKKMLRYIRETIPDKQAVAAVASEPRFEMLFRSLGLQKITGTLFRRNSK